MNAAAESGRNPVEESTKLSLAMENGQGDAVQDGRHCLARRTSQARTETGKYSFSLFN